MSRNLLVVLSTLFQNRGGIPRFNQMLCLALERIGAEAGIAVTVISQDDSDADYAAAGRPWPRLRFVGAGRRPRLIAATLRHCIRERPRLVLVGLLGMTPLALLCSPFVERGFGFIAHGTEAWREPRRSRRLAARRARFVLAVSRNTADALCRETGLAPEAVRVFPNTLDPAFPVGDASAAERGLELLTVARLEADEGRKGIDHTIEALAGLRQRHPAATLRVVGIGSDKPRLVELARRLDLGERVIFEEGLSDEELSRRYRQCAAFVLPSGQEGFGIVFLEAMAVAKPCVGARAGGIPEVVEDGTTGLLVPFGDVAALSGALDRLLADRELRQRLGRAGLERLTERFVFERFQERLAGILEEMLAGS